SRPPHNKYPPLPDPGTYGFHSLAPAYSPLFCPTLHRYRKNRKYQKMLPAPPVPAKRFLSFPAPEGAGSSRFRRIGGLSRLLLLPPETLNDTGIHNMPWHRPGSPDLPAA